MHRVLRLLMLLVLLAPAAGSMPARAATSVIPLDLAAMALRPADLEMPGAGYDYGPPPRYYDLEDYADRNRLPTQDASEVASDYAAAGFLGEYEATLGAPEGPDGNPASFSVKVQAFIESYATTEGADAGFDLDEELVRSSGNGFTIDPDAPAIEDRAILVRQEGLVEGGNGQTYQLVEIITRSDDLVIGVWLQSFSLSTAAGQAAVATPVPASATQDAEVARLLRIVLDRADAVRAGDAPNLSWRTLQMDSDGFGYNSGRYEIIDREILPDFGAPTLPPTSAALDADLPSLWYRVSHGVVGPDGVTISTYHGSLLAFASDAGASAYMAFDSFATPVDLGDEATFSTYQTAGTDQTTLYQIATVIVRVGPLVAVTQVQFLTPGPDPELAALTLAKAQLACLMHRQSACAPVPAPAEFAISPQPQATPEA